MLRLTLALLATFPVYGQHVNLRAYPQKFRTFHQPGDPGIPAALTAANPAPPAGQRVEATATDGAVWHRAVWKGVSKGLVRQNPRAPEPDRVQYMAGLRYLPDDEVLALAPDPSDGMWVRTRTGVSHIELRPMTLRQKSELFEQRIRQRHDRYGFVSSSNLQRAGDLSSNRLDPSDNDGLWTAMYAAAECFRYAVTKSPEALANARKSIDAILFLEEVTGRPGYPARSYIRKGDWRGQGGVWHWTPDGAYEWKGDTSSDEIVGHYYIFGIAWDLLPDPALRKRIAAAVTRITDHILEHRYNLTDVHGQPTYWGRWSPEYFETPRGKPDAPLNALELLSMLKTAHHITGQQKYADAYRHVAINMKYAEMTTRLLELREVINYSDEELAMLPFYLLFRYERDPAMLAIYRRALDQWWENIRRENNPLWTFIYMTGRPGAKVDLDGALRTLYRIPVDLINWSVANSHRQDVEFEGAPDRFKRRQAKTLLPPDERPVMKWNGNPFIVDGGGPGHGEDDGAFFLLPYWMGRHHKFLLGE